LNFVANHFLLQQLNNQFNGKISRQLSNLVEHIHRSKIIVSRDLKVIQPSMLTGN